ncbi:hypothetical protein RCL1_007196 [Eukaryota sp. TZLM3-RCL]
MFFAQRMIKETSDTYPDMATFPEAFSQINPKLPVAYNTKQEVADQLLADGIYLIFTKRKGKADGHNWVCHLTILKTNPLVTGRIPKIDFQINRFLFPDLEEHQLVKFSVRKLPQEVVFVVEHNDNIRFYCNSMFSDSIQEYVKECIAMVNLVIPSIDVIM